MVMGPGQPNRPGRAIRRVRLRGNRASPAGPAGLRGRPDWPYWDRAGWDRNPRDGFAANRGTAPANPRPVAREDRETARRPGQEVAADFSAAAVCSSEAMVFSGFLIFLTLRRPRKANRPARTSMRTKTMVNATQRGSQMARISPSMKKKNHIENAPMTAATPKNAPPVAPVLTVSVISSLASSISDLTRVDMCVVTSLTRAPIEAVRSTAGSATSGMDAPVDPGGVN